jgi:hypothetical protein
LQEHTVRKEGFLLKNKKPLSEERKIFAGQATVTDVIFKTLHVICKTSHMLYVIIVSTLSFA